MTTDEKVELAERIARQMVGIIPSEWRRWSSYAKRYDDLSKGLAFANAMKTSPSLRPGAVQSYRTISDVLSRFYKQLQSLPPEDRNEVLEYVHRCLIARRAFGTK